jgi:maleylpyruvate isomerase
MRPEAEIAVCRASHGRLLESVDALTEAQLREASLLPRYSRAHVVAHVTNKAWAHVGLFDAAAIGEVRRIHPEGYDPDLAASAGASGSAGELQSELRGSLAAVEEAWDRLDDDKWDRQALMMAGPRTMAEVIGHHLRNIETHHVDLHIGYLPTDWPGAFVDDELARRLRGLPDRADHPHLLAWLLGRGPAPELRPW